MYMLSSENKFVFFRTWEDEKNYDKTFDDGFFFNGEEPVMTVDKLPTSYEEFISQCVTDAAYSVGGLYTDDKDRERYIIDRYQTYLKFHEKATLGSGEKDKAKVENDDLEDNLRNLQEIMKMNIMMMRSFMRKRKVSQPKLTSSNSKLGKNIATGDSRAQKKTLTAE